MKRYALFLLAWFSVTVLASAQAPRSYVFFDASNSQNIFTVVYDDVSGGGDHIIGSGPLTFDVNATLLGGPDASHLQPMVTLLLSNGTAQYDMTAFNDGHFYDWSGNSYVVPGVTNGAIGTFQIQIWTGNYSSFQNALAGTASVAQTVPFQNPTAVIGPPVPSLDNTPSLEMIVYIMPEPSSFSIAGLATVLAFIFRRRK